MNIFIFYYLYINKIKIIFFRHFLAFFLLSFNDNQKNADYKFFKNSKIFQKQKWTFLYKNL